MPCSSPVSKRLDEPLKHNIIDKRLIDRRNDSRSQSARTPRHRSDRRDSLDDQTIVLVFYATYACFLRCVLAFSETHARAETASNGATLNLASTNSAPTLHFAGTRCRIQPFVRSTLRAVKISQTSLNLAMTRASATVDGGERALSQMFRNRTNLLAASVGLFACWRHSGGAPSNHGCPSPEIRLLLICTLSHALAEERIKEDQCLKIVTTA